MDEVNERNVEVTCLTVSKEKSVSLPAFQVWFVVVWHGTCVLWRTGLAVVQSWCHRRQPRKKTSAIAVEKPRRAQGSDTCNPSQERQFRSLAGAIHWPAGQSMILASATVSFLQAGQKIQSLTIFLKRTETSACTFQEIDRSCACWRIGATRTLDHATRRVKPKKYHGLSSPRQYNTEPLAVPKIVLDWSSRRLERQRRSSVSAEAHSAANTLWTCSSGSRFTSHS